MYYIHQDPRDFAVFYDVARICVIQPESKGFLAWKGNWQWPQCNTRQTFPTACYASLLMLSV